MILRARAHARERGSGRRKRKGSSSFSLSLSFFYPLLPTSAACLPVVRPTVRLLFSSLLPFIRVEWLMGSRRHRGISLFTPHRTPPFDPSDASRPSSTRAHRWVFCFSSRQIIAPPLTQHGDCTTLLHTFSVPSVYRINIAAPWNEAINWTESLTENWSNSWLVTKVWNIRYIVDFFNWCEEKKRSI